MAFIFHKKLMVFLEQIYLQLLGNNRVVGLPNTPVAVETKLGYVVMGSAPVLSSPVSTHSFCITLEPTLEHLVQRFWEVEDIPSSTAIDQDALECEKTFQSTYSRDTSGRYTVALPFKLDSSLLGDSYSVALQRFLCLEKRLHSNSFLRDKYVEIIRDYLVQGHMSKVVENNCYIKQYFIPHHTIFKVDSNTTPIRIVFDGSCKTDTLYSLNDLLFTGPKLQSDVCTMFLNFRLLPVALTADIRQMYRQINLFEDDRRFHGILWRFSPDDPTEMYQLNTVTFGVKSSPFLAIRTVRQLAEDENSSLPLASETVKRDMYVDDPVTSVSSHRSALDLYHQLVELFRR
uniref:Peptidase aspartic putative domain-containing protein n=1 Tax=Anoplophora glabripennis TaxID=217634 RepID=V5GTD1_ANOGL